MAARGIRRIIELALDAAAARRMQREAQEALDRATDPAGARENLGEVERATDRISGAAGRLRGAFDKVWAALGTIGLTVGAGAVLKFLVDANREAQSLKAQLKVTEGSEADAASRFRAIQDFAKSTPFEVGEITAAFLDLRTSGIAPTARMMTAFGDIASSRGKNIRDFSMAVQDALTGEMERLKEFGVTSQQSGDKVKLTFNGQTVEVQRTRGAILEYLQSVGEMKGVQGSMAEQMTTLNGLISNIWDNLNNLAVAAGEEGAAGAMGSLLGKVQEFTADLATNRTEIRFWVGAIGAAVKFIGSVIAGTVRSLVGFTGIAFGLLHTQVIAVQTAVATVVNTVKGTLNSFLDQAASVPLLGRFVTPFRFELTDVSRFRDSFVSIGRNIIATAREIGDAFGDTAQAWAEMAASFDRRNSPGGGGQAPGAFGDGSVVGGDTNLGAGAKAARETPAQKLARLRRETAAELASIPSQLPRVEIGEVTRMYGQMEKAHSAFLARQHLDLLVAQRAYEDAWLSTHQLLIDVTTGAADEFSNAWGEAFGLLFEQGATFGAFMETVARGTAKALLGGLSQFARGKQMEEIAETFAMLAKAYGNPPMAPVYLKSAAMHGLAAGAWAALAGFGGAAASAAGGGGGGGVRGGGSAGLDTAQNAKRMGPEINIFIDGIDPRNPRHQDLTAAAVAQARERWGDQRINVHPRSAA